MSLKPGSGANVSIRAVSFGYSQSETILDGLSLEIQAGEFVSVLGPSGCGKSTLLRLIAALDSPNQGSVQLSSTKSPLIRGFVFQEPRLLPWRTVLENVKLPLELSGHSNEANLKKASEAIEKVGLSQASSKFPTQLSGGMKMRVSVARALVLEPSLLLLDEPFSALDESIRHALQEDLRSLWMSLKMTVVFVTHSAAEAVYLADRLILLSKSPSRALIDRPISLPQDRQPKVRFSSEYRAEIEKISEHFSNAREVL